MLGQFGTLVGVEEVSMEGHLTMSQKVRQRLVVLDRVSGSSGMTDASILLGITYRTHGGYYLPIVRREPRASFTVHVGSRLIINVTHLLVIRQLLHIRVNMATLALLWLARSYWKSMACRPMPKRCGSGCPKRYL
jgi:hypothetical protein